MSHPKNAPFGDICLLTCQVSKSTDDNLPLKLRVMAIAPISGAAGIGIGIPGDICAAAREGKGYCSRCINKKI